MKACVTYFYEFQHCNHYYGHTCRQERMMLQKEWAYISAWFCCCSVEALPPHHQEPRADFLWSYVAVWPLMLGPVTSVTRMSFVCSLSLNSTTSLGVGKWGTWTSQILHKFQVVHLDQWSENDHAYCQGIGWPFVEAVGGDTLSAVRTAALSSIVALSTGQSQVLHSWFSQHNSFHPGSDDTCCRWVHTLRWQ